jgi:serine/threonine protein kinase
MSQIIKIKATDGSNVEFVDEIIGQGGMKDVYFSPDKSYVVAFFRDKQDASAKDRLLMITSKYYEGIFSNTGGDYWRDLYCWPNKVVEFNGKIGVVAPTYPKHFFFKTGSRNNDFLNIKGKEKEGKWFASAFHQNKNLDPSEKGDWFKYFIVCLNISRAVRRMHSAGLAHSDLSYKNVLVDPSTGKAAIIDIDGLVVPGKYPPDVIGTPDFIAPEVMATKNLAKEDKARKLPSIRTDRHALAVMIYMYLLRRHPLRGGKLFAQDPEKDEELGMGEQALFVESATDPSNRPNLNDIKPSYLPWADVQKIPYSIVGPYLKPLFEKAFIEGLHSPELRPTADEWENALIKSIDLMQPCQNPTCEMKWYVFENTTKPRCPFCQTAYTGQLPILNMYAKNPQDKFVYENNRLMVYHNQYIYKWHLNKRIIPNERLLVEDKKPVGYFTRHNGAWVLVNQNIPDLEDVTEKQTIPIGQMLVLKENQQILLSKEEGGRLCFVQIVNNQ